MKHITGKIALLILLFVSIGLVVSPKAAFSGESEVGVGLMYSNISEEDGRDDGFGLGISYIRTILPGVSAEAGFDYKKFDFKGNDGTLAGDITTLPIRFTGQYRFGLMGSAIPWLGAGVGYYFNKVDFQTDPKKEELANPFNIDCIEFSLDCNYSVPTELKDVFGFHVGGGLDFPLKEVTLSIALEYRFLKSDLERNLICSGIDCESSLTGPIPDESIDLGGIDIRFWLKYDIATLFKEWIR